MLTDNFRKNFIVSAKGFLMGIAEVIPGVSGSTLALILGIYKEFISLLYSISNVVKEFLRFLIFKSTFEELKNSFRKIDYRFAFFLLAGMILAIALFSNLIHFLLENHRMYVMAFFFGLVLASVSIPWREIKTKKNKDFVLVIVTAIVFFFIFSLKPHVFEQAPHPAYFFFGGALGICAMILPGVSGSFIFLMLGIYEFIVSAIRSLTKFEISSSEVLNLVSVALGIFFGFTIFVRILKFGLKNNSSTIFAFLTGLMISSLRVLWVFGNVQDFVFVLPTMILGFSLVVLLKKFVV